MVLRPFVRFLPFAFAVTASAFATRTAASQCATTWRPNAGIGPTGAVFATVAYDPDGSGPANPLVMAGGYFGLPGSVGLRNVAIYDQVTNAWSPLGQAFDSTVLAVARLGNGDLVAGGGFQNVGPLAANSIARWNGAAWAPIGPGLPAAVRALAELPNGDLVAGGDFGIRRWDGAAWQTMGNGPSFVGALAVMPNGALAAGGNFGGQFAVATWNGVQWSQLGPAANGDMRSLLVLANGDLLAGGAFVNFGGVSTEFVARWNGTSWSALPGLQHSARALTQLPGGDVVAAGGLAPAAAVTSLVSRWNGSTWTPLATAMDSASWTLATLANGDLFAGGTFTTISGTSQPFTARLTTTCPAASAVAGTGCTGPAGPVALAAQNLPWAGGTFRAVATGMPALGVAVHVVGFGSLSLPLASVLPQALPGCSLFATPDLLDVLYPNGGVVDAPIALPRSAAIAGFVLRQQVVPIELSATLGITSVASSNALQLTVGFF